MRKLLFIGLFLISVYSCRKDDDRGGPCSGATSPPPNPSVSVRIFDYSGNNLIFGVKPKYLFDSLRIDAVYKDTTFTDKKPYRKINAIGDTVIGIPHFYEAKILLRYPNNGVTDTFEYVLSKEEEGLCFPIYYFDVYYNNQLKLKDFSSNDRDSIINIIK